MTEITKTPQKTEDPLETIKAIAKGLTAKQRKELQDAGVFIPSAAVGVLNGVRKWGYLCRQCGEVAIEFVGDSFQRVRADGETVTVTPKSAREFPEMGWMEVQIMPPEDKDRPCPRHENGNLVHPIRTRNNPRCCHCGQQLRKGADGGLHPDNVVLLDLFRASSRMDRSTQRARYNKFLEQESKAKAEGKP